MIRFENVQIKYGDFVAVQNLNLEVKEGEFFTLLGPSGCGKTTTLRSLAGFITPAEGKIYINDVDVTYTPIEKRGVGMVFQSYALFPTMSVFDNIAFGLKVEKKNKDYIVQRVDELAKMVDLSQEHLEKNVAELSGGQQQRVAIARALAKKPSILVMDEPLSNLDAKLRKQLRNELKGFQKEFGITTIYVTHDQEEALTLSDRIAVFNKGFVEQIGTPSEIYNRPATEFVCKFIGDATELSNELIQYFNEEHQLNLDQNKKAFIRPEKISTTPLADGNGHIQLSARVIHKEFNGTHSLYTFQIKNSQITAFEKEDGQVSFNPGEEVQIYLNPANILQY